MADQRSKLVAGLGRVATPPLWSNVSATGGLTFNTGGVPTLLVPYSAVEARSDENVDNSLNTEVDNFIGQEASAPLTQNAASSLFSTGASQDYFLAGFGTNALCRQPVQQSSASATSFVSARSDPSISTLSAPVSSYAHQDQLYGNNSQWSSTMQHAPEHTQPPLIPLYNPSSLQLNSQPSPAALHYTPVVQHWFYCKMILDKPVWQPFSYRDSMALEDSFLNGTPEAVHTNGQRYDVLIDERIRRSVFWQEEPCEVRRCSWFYRDDSSMMFIPYSEDLSEELEELYRVTLFSNSWHRRNTVTNSEDIFVFHSANVFVQFSKGSFPDEYGASFSEQSRPRVVKRGVADFEPISEGETPQVDHVVFVVHGIGPFCDLKCRGIVEVVDDMRATANSILSSHFKSSVQSGKVGRVEFLPIYWHDALRTDAIGVDRRLHSITLSSIKKLRHFTNEFLLDILFYNSPLYSQGIVEKVGKELNRLYALFKARNPLFQGRVSLAGHSLGSLVLFDLLSMQGVVSSTVILSNSNQKSEPLSEAVARSRSVTPDIRATPVEERGVLRTIETMESLLEHLSLSNLSDKFHQEQIDLDALLMCSEDDLKSIGLPLGPRKKILKYVAEKEHRAHAVVTAGTDKEVAAEPQLAKPVPKIDKSQNWLVETASNTQVAYIGGLQGIGLPLVSYPQLDFQVENFFALGSPIAMFLTIRGIEHLSRDFHLPTCHHMFNIFHPFDPVAYRIEPLINPSIQQKPVMMPHHKGRKRLHLELKENLVKVGADIKERLLRSLKTTWASINDFARAHRAGAVTTDNAVGEDTGLDEQVNSMLESARQQADTSTEIESISSLDEEVEVGQLNQGKRIDFVLQEAPLESFNEYLFALASHVVYWDSEDVALMLMKECYRAGDILPDSKSPQQNQMPTLPQNPPVWQPPVAPSIAAATQPSVTTPYPGLQGAASSQSHTTAMPPTMLGFNSAAVSNSFGILQSGPPPMSGFVASGPPPRYGFIPKQ